MRHLVRLFAFCNGQATKNLLVGHCPKLEQEIRMYMVIGNGLPLGHVLRI